MRFTPLELETVTTKVALHLTPRFANYPRQLGILQNPDRPRLKPLCALNRKVLPACRTHCVISCCCIFLILVFYTFHSRICSLAASPR